MSRKISPVALSQLAAWRKYASRWYWYAARRDTETGHRLGQGKEQFHLVCPVCDTSMTVIMSEGTGYLLNVELILDAVTRHLRNQHRDMEGVVYGGQDSPTGADPRRNSDHHGAGANPR